MATTNTKREALETAQTNIARRVAEQTRRGHYADLPGAIIQWIAETAAGNRTSKRDVTGEMLSLAMIIDVCQRLEHIAVRKTVPPGPAPDFRHLAKTLADAALEHLPDYSDLVAHLIDRGGLTLAACHLQGLYVAARETAEAVAVRLSAETVEAAQAFARSAAETEALEAGDKVVEALRAITEKRKE